MASGQFCRLGPPLVWVELGRQCLRLLLEKGGLGPARAPPLLRSSLTDEVLRTVPPSPEAAMAAKRKFEIWLEMLAMCQNDGKPKRKVANGRPRLVQGSSLDCLCWWCVQPLMLPSRRRNLQKRPLPGTSVSTWLATCHSRTRPISLYSVVLSLCPQDAASRRFWDPVIRPLTRSTVCTPPFRLRLACAGCSIWSG